MDYHRMTLNKLEESLDTDLRNGLTANEASFRYKLMKNKSSLSELTYKKLIEILKRISIVRTISIVIMLNIIFKNGNKLHILSAIFSIGVNITIRALKYSKESKEITLKNIVKKKYMVIREGREQKINGKDIVLGDLVLLSKGIFIPADIRLIYSEKFKVDEFVFTGNHKSLSKNNERIIEEIYSNMELSNIVFMGSLVEKGEAYGIVIADHMNSRLTKLLDIEKTESIFNKKVKKPIFTGVLFILALISMVSFSLDNFFGSNKLIEEILYYSFLLIITMPYFLGEEIFSYSLKKEYKKYNIRFKNLKSIVKLREVKEFYLNAQEDLDYRGKRIEGLYYDGTEVNLNFIEKDSYTFKRLMEGLLLTYENDQWPKEDKSDEGLENQLINTFSSINNIFIDDIKEYYNHCFYLPENLERVLKGRVFEHNKNYRVYLKGEASELISCCSSIMLEGVEKPITNNQIKAIKEWNYAAVSKGHNTIAVGYRNFKYNPSLRDRIDSNIVFVGIISIADILEKYNYESINYLLRNNIGLSLFTDKNPAALLNLWKELGLINEISDLLTGAQLDNMEDSKLSEVLGSSNIFSKINSSEKERIIKAKKEEECKAVITGRTYSDFIYLSTCYLSVAVGDGALNDIVNISDVWIKEDSLRKLVYLREEGCIDLYSFRRYQESVLLTFFLELVFILFFGYEHLYFVNFVIIPIIALSLSVREREAPEEKKYTTSAQEYKSTAFLRFITISALALISYLMSIVLLDLENFSGSIFILVASLLISSINYSYKRNRTRRWIIIIILFSISIFIITVNLMLNGMSNILFNIILVFLYLLADLYLFKRT